MKRIISVVVLTAALATVADPTATALAYQPKGHYDRWHGPCSTWQYGERLLTPGAYFANVARAQRQLHRLVVCVFDRFAPGNAEKALAIAERESGFYPWADNPTSHCRGFFQHLPGAWAGRALDKLWRGWFKHWPARWWDPRANTIVAARMVAEGGWGPWGG